MPHRLAPADEPFYSSRNDIPFSEVPTKRGSIYGESIVVHHKDDYASILDTVYEMADQIATANGTTIEDAIEQVLRHEGWRILPKHRALIKTIWEQPDCHVQLVAPGGTHCYSIGTQRSGKRFDIDVIAKTRTQAATFARKNGYMVRDVNMIG